MQKSSSLGSTTKHMSPDPEHFSESQVHSRSSKRRKTTPSEKEGANGIFPLDVWLLIADSIPSRDTQTLAALSRVSQTLYQIFSPRLYRDVVAAAPSHKSIRGFIEGLQQYLSVTQRQLLHSERRYPGQWYHKGVDEELVPYCSQYVKHLLVGWTNPGEGHLPSLARYIEEFLKNAPNLEAIVWIDCDLPFTIAIGEIVGKLQKLKAFTFNMCATHELASLRQIRNLTYLDIYSHQSYSNPSHSQEVLSASSHTLETLIFEEAMAAEKNQIYLGKLVLHNGKKIVFPNLHTICIKPYQLELDDVQALMNAINFQHLTYFEFSTSEYEEGKFSHEFLFQALLDQTSAYSSARKLSWKTFRFRSQQPIYPSETFLSILSSFDTLTTFVFEEMRHSKGDTEQELTSVEDLLSALEPHKNLTWLSINVPSPHGIRWKVSPLQLSKIQSSFPRLEHLTCVCEQSAQGDFFSILPTFRHLSCFYLPAVSWVNLNSETSITGVIESICKPFLRQLSDGAPLLPKWEYRYKFRMVVLGHSAYVLGSGLQPEPPKSRYQSREVSSEGHRILYKPVRPGEIRNSEFANLSFMKASEWRIRNYDASGDWYQGIKF
ncbi:hypothetical protein H072_4339 [Dactylellina haptotyla CBS 200.50]|uniref:Uncharacterized protein n=1 Tax=Dactylellina haptotyla (strain CBS 200.50) TaxID=1284197 RepID=S8AFB1_DACHA|nr:hypothetical protein H072_4339 [Dactylellina haptotyla CBS 200.50]